MTLEGPICSIQHERVVPQVCAAGVAVFDPPVHGWGPHANGREDLVTGLDLVAGALVGNALVWIPPQGLAISAWDGLTR